MNNRAYVRASELDGRFQLEGWQDFLGEGNYTEDQMNRLSQALFQAQRDYVDGLLPDGFFWSDGTSEIIGPDHTDVDTNSFKEIIEDSGNAVITMFEEIELETLGEESE